ncbi:MAG TPA: adenylate/guanylate cyclase domain-containing protein [Dehalococcoidia bacterium]
MESEIQYAETEDGLGIAYREMGQGPPLIYMPHPPFTNIELAVQLARRAYAISRAAQNFRVILYDSRGSGMSERRLDNYSIDGFLLDLQAVVDKLQLPSFALFAQSNSGPVALTYAARNSDRVDRLILQNAWVRDSDWSSLPELKALSGMFDKDWQTYTETFARVVLGWESTEDAQKYAAMIRASSTPETIREWTLRGRRMDATETLAAIKCPTLILHTRDHRMLKVDVAKRIASKIKDARLVLTEHMIPDDDTVKVIDEFLGVANATIADQKSPVAADVHTILFTDVEGSTALTDRLGDAKARDLLREHERITREALKAHGGAEVKTLGDGFMASFSSATRALECAIAMQQAFAEHSESADEPIKVRIGLNAGEPIAEDDPGGRGDLFGTAVNMAARIAAKAEGGEILASNVVRELVAGKEFLFNDRGETELRGFEDPVRVYEVRWRDG